MTECTHTFFTAWGDLSTESRAANAGAALGTNFYYADLDAPEQITDREAYLGYVNIYGDMMPDGSAEVVHFSGQNGHSHAMVTLCTDGVAMQHDQYFTGMSDGKITRLIGCACIGEPE